MSLLQQLLKCVVLSLLCSGFGYAWKFPTFSVIVRNQFTPSTSLYLHDKAAAAEWLDNWEPQTSPAALMRQRKTDIRQGRKSHVIRAVIESAIQRQIPIPPPHVLRPATYMGLTVSSVELNGDDSIATLYISAPGSSIDRRLAYVWFSRNLPSFRAALAASPALKRWKKLPQLRVNMVDRELLRILDEEEHKMNSRSDESSSSDLLDEQLN